MRLVYKVFVNPDDRSSEPVLFETDDKGENRRIIEGKPPERGSIRRVPAYVEVSCDDTSESVKSALEGLQKIKEKLANR